MTAESDRPGTTGREECDRRGHDVFRGLRRLWSAPRDRGGRVVGVAEVIACRRCDFYVERPPDPD